MPHSKTIYLGIKGTVIAINAATGAELWAAELKGNSFVNVALDGDNLYAATQGEVFCLNPQTGETRWHNPLRGFGYGLVSIAGEGITGDSSWLQFEEKRRRDQRDSSSGSSPGQVM